MNALEATIAYAARGWSVFPCWWPLPDGRCACVTRGCDKVGKHPLGKAAPRGRNDATTDSATIRGWWRQWPQANVGIATGLESGLVVLDVDPAHGGEESLIQLEFDHGTLPDTLVSLTGGGGSHSLFAHPRDRKVTSRVGLPGYPGLDTRADGGYIVVPPSMHRSGMRYVWNGHLHPEALTLAPCPEWLIDLAGAHAKPSGRARAGNGAGASGRIAQGSRNATLASIAGAMRRKGTSPEAIEAALIVENGARCEPPLDDAEVRGIAASVGQYPPASGEAFRVNRVYRVSSERGDWPAPLAPVVFHGLPGEFVRLVEPHTEADPAALLLHFLVMLGSVSGRSRYFAVEATRHFPNLFAVIVGDTSRGRKGTAKDQTLRHFEAVDSPWAADRVQSGLSSGEGLIWAVRDTISKREPVKECHRVTGYQEVEVDHGVADKRLLAIEPEFASVLRMVSREGNVLSAVVRDAWDRGHLRILTKSSPAHATDAHISIIGHITREELRAELTRTDAASGFANRFLWVGAKRSKLLPEGGRLGDVDFAPLHSGLEEVVRFARTAGEVQRDPDARELWAEVYGDLSRGVSGLFGAVTSRAEAQVTRLSLVYALAACSEAIRLPHLQAALAVWRYCEASARCIFGDSLGDPVADDILRELRAAPDGLTRNEIRDHFKRNRRSEEIGRALDVLARFGRAHAVSEETGGRPAERWFAASYGYAKYAENAESVRCE